MRIAVLVKQVPETRSVRMDESTGTVIRQGSESIANPLDLYAVQAALLCRKNNPEARITAFSMGPPTAEKVLREALALGADDAVLISDRAFAGSDTWATAMILMAALRHTGKFDLVLTGERATDGDTGQVGPELAAALDIPVVSFIESLTCAKNSCNVRRKTEHGVEDWQVQFPALLCVTKGIGEPGLPTLAQAKIARRQPIPVLTQQELQLNPDEIGLKGSPTKVVKIFHPTLSRQCRLTTVADEAMLNAAAREFARFVSGGVQ